MVVRRVLGEVFRYLLQCIGVNFLVLRIMRATQRWCAVTDHEDNEDFGGNAFEMMMVAANTTKNGTNPSANVTARYVRGSKLSER